MFLVARGFADAGDPPNRVARLSYMENAVSFEPAGENDWSQATLNYPLTTGDRLWTDVNARAELETGNVAIRMSQQTDLTTTSLTDQLLQLGLAKARCASGFSICVPATPSRLILPALPSRWCKRATTAIDTYPDQNMTMLTVNSGERAGHRK